MGTYEHARAYFKGDMKLAETKLTEDQHSDVILELGQVSAMAQVITDLVIFEPSLEIKNLLKFHLIFLEPRIPGACDERY